MANKHPQHLEIRHQLLVSLVQVVEDIGLLEAVAVELIMEDFQRLRVVPVVVLVDLMLEQDPVDNLHQDHQVMALMLKKIPDLVVVVQEKVLRHRE